MTEGIAMRQGHGCLALGGRRGLAGRLLAGTTGRGAPLELEARTSPLRVPTAASADGSPSQAGVGQGFCSRIIGHFTLNA